MTDRLVVPSRDRSRRAGPRLAPPVAALLLALSASHPAARAQAGAAETPAETLRAEAIRHEHGEGTARDPQRAAQLYCSAARLGDAVAQYNLGWMYANGRGLDRNDAWAAYFFKAAAEQGIEQARRMLDRVGGPTSQVPDCMKDPVAPAPAGGASSPAGGAAASSKPLQARVIVPPKAIAGLVNSLAPAYGVEPQLALAIIQAESNFDAQAQSPKNARGLMQLIPETAERFRVQDPFDPKQNIRGGLAYLRWLLAYFQGDLSLVVAAYNAGEGAVERHRGVPPYPETRGYVSRVLAAVGALAHPFDARVTAPSAQLPLILQKAAAAAAATAQAATPAAAAPAAARPGRVTLRLPGTALATAADEVRGARSTLGRAVR